MYGKSGSFPAGGNNSTASANSTVGCIDGANGFQSYNFVLNTSTYKCTIGDAAVATGLLPSTLFSDLPPNARIGSKLEVFMTYPCGTKYYLFYSVESPTGAETAAINSVISDCPTLASVRDTYLMRGAKELSP